MATYVPNADQLTEPVESREVVTSAAEHRAIKAKLEAVQTAVEAVEDSALQLVAGAYSATEDIDMNGNDILDAGLVSAAELRLGGLIFTPADFDPDADSAALLRGDLANSGGAGRVGWIQSAVGAVARSTSDKLSDTTSVKDFGALGLSGVDNTMQINAARTASKTLHFDDVNYYTTAPINFGRTNILGKNLSTLNGPGASFSGAFGADIYCFEVSSIWFDGQGTIGQTGLTSSYAHKGLYSGLKLVNYQNAARLNNAFLTTAVGLYSAANINGVVLESNTNACAFFGSSFNNNQTFGLRVGGSYANTFIGCDFEYNFNGAILTNTMAAGDAEQRGTNVVFNYFEGNTDNQLIIGDNPGVSDVVVESRVIGNYFSVENATTGITVAKSVNAKILWNNFGGTYSVGKIFLRSTSQNTTVIPFRQPDVVSEAGATVSIETIQKGVVSISLDAAGNGFADVVFAVPYSNADMGLPPVFVQKYETTDVVTAVSESIRLNSLTPSGFRIRVVGGPALGLCRVLWRAGA